MSDSSSTSPSHQNRRVVAIIGLAVVFAIILLINILVGKMSFKVDLTENKVHTLSDGTKKILAGLETPIEIRYYATDGSDVMSPSERAAARRAEDLLSEFVKAAPVKEIVMVNEAGEDEAKQVKMLTVKKLNPAPNTDAEDSAILDNIPAGSSGETGNELYFGLAVSSLDANESIPFIPSRPETLLEYDVARAISSVDGGKEKKISILTPLRITGGYAGNYSGQPAQAWMIYEQLVRDYTVEFMSMDDPIVPEGTTTLIVLHPYGISDDAQFAIDQYLLGGGNVLAFVDPNFFYARALAPQNPGMPGMQAPGGPEPSSHLAKLFEAWGVTYDAGQVLADLDFASEILQPGNYCPTFLTLNQSALGENPEDPGRSDPMTQTLNLLEMLTPGAFTISPPEGVKVDRLVLTSANNQLVSSVDADPTAEGGTDRIRENFEPHDSQRVLVARLSGNFKTAFPDGDPALAAEEEAAADENEAESTPEEVAPESLKESTAPGHVVLIADVDFIFDANVVQRQQIPGTNISIPQLRNENLALVQNAAEQLSGDHNLLDVRSRDSARRPFTRQNEWYQEAQEKYEVQLEEFSAKATEVETELNAILAETPKDLDQALIAPEVQDKLRELQEQAVEFNKKERELQKEVTREFRRKLAAFKFGNAALVPALVLLFGIGLAIARHRRVSAR